MQRPSPTTTRESEDEYRTIEGALLESARGRWFLAEHGRRARRLDSALLEDAIGRLQSSLRQPPALLGQLKSEIERLRSQIAAARTDLLAKPVASGWGEPGDGAPPMPHAILKAAEDIHDSAWSLQGDPFDPARCEDIARNAGRLYALSHGHAVQSKRVLVTAAALDEAAHKLEAMLETVLHELQIDTAQGGTL